MVGCPQGQKRTNEIGRWAVNDWLTALKVIRMEDFQKAVDFIANVLGQQSEEVTELFKAEDGVNKLQSAFASRLKKERDEARTEAAKGTAGKVQKELNAKAKELFGIEVEADTHSGVLEAVKAKYQPTVDPATISENDIKKHPIFLSKEAEVIKLQADLNKEIEKLKGDYEGKLSFVKLEGLALKALNDLKAVLPAHEGQKKVLVDVYLTQYQDLEERSVDGNSYYYSRSTGKRIEDAYGKPLNMNQITELFVKNHFEVEGSQKQSPGMNDGQRQKTNGGGRPVPKTDAEMNAILSDSSISREEKKAIFEAFKSSAKPNSGT